MPDQPAFTPDAFAGQAERGGESAASLAPNMFGDLFGGRPQQLIIARPAIIIPESRRNIQGVIGLPAPASGFSTYVAGGQGNVIDGFSAFNSDGTVPGSAQFAGVTLSPAPAFQVVGGNIIVSLTGLPGSVALVENPAVTSAVGTVANPGEIVQFLNGTAINLVDNGQDIVADVNQNYDLVTPAQTIQQPPLTFFVPTPTGGGVVGRTKIADDNSPLPRDRFIFNYDYFNNVPLAADGIGVHRFSAGFEKTFLKQMASVELRVPFASTLSSSIVADGLSNSSQAEFGNVYLTLKGLLHAGPKLYVASGVGVSVPTANDVRVATTDGTDLIRIHNDTWVLTPYGAFLYTPNQRFFCQGWGAVGFGLNGNGVDVVNSTLTGMNRVGRLNDQNLLQLDSQMGYWVVRNNCCSDSLLQGLAPFVELHYNTGLGSTDTVRAGLSSIGASSSFNELNLSAGILAQIGDRFNLSIGVAAPMLDSPDRTFDWQLGIRGNILFGPTVRNRNRATYVSSY